MTMIYAQVIECKQADLLKNQLVIEEMEDGAIVIGGVASQNFILKTINALVELKNSIQKEGEPKLCVTTVTPD